MAPGSPESGASHQTRARNAACRQRDDRAAGPALEQAGEPNLAEPTQEFGHYFCWPPRRTSSPIPSEAAHRVWAFSASIRTNVTTALTTLTSGSVTKRDRADTAPQGGQPFGVGELETGRFAESGAMHPQQADLADQRLSR